METEVTQTSTETAETESSGATEQASSGGEVSGVEVGNSFTPNYKVKVMDQEREIDPMFHGLIKDAQSEKKIREIFERAYGHEFLKPKYETMKGELDTYKPAIQEYQNLQQTIGGLSQMIAREDLGSFLEATQIPKQLVFKWVHQELQKMQMDPEQRQQMEQQNNLQREYYTQQSVLQQQQQMMQQMQTQYENFQVQARSGELNNHLSRPEVRSIAEQFDQRVGQPGAFRNEVIRRGQLAWNTQQKDLSAEEAVTQVLTFAQALMGQPTQEMPDSENHMVDARTGATVPQPKRGATIPNITGRGSSPVRKAPRSIEELKKLASEL